MNRHYSLGILLAASAAASAAALSGTPRVSIGDLRDGTAWAVVAPGSGTGTVQFEVASNAEFTTPLMTVALQVDDAMVPAKVRIDGLTTGARYYFRATEGTGMRVGTFKAVAAKVATPAGMPGGRFGVSGDWRGDIGLFTSISNADERDLGFFVKLGDTVYADVVSPAVPAGPAQTLQDFRAKHVENVECWQHVYGSCQLDPWGELFAVVPTYAMIDDHEVTNNFSGGARLGDGSWYNQGSLFANGLQAFVEHNPMEPRTYATVGDDRTDGRYDLYRSFSWGRDIAVMMVDTRSFRDVNVTPVTNPFDPAQVIAYLTATFNPARTLLSQRQLARLIGDLEAAERAGATWKFIMTSVPMQSFGPLQGEDRWEGYAAERAFLLQQIATRGIRNVVFVTADFHGTIINDITVPNPTNPTQQLFTGTWEIITGSVAYSAPAGPTLAQLGLSTGAITPQQFAFYGTLPNAGKDPFISAVLDGVLTGFGLSPVGIQDPSISATLEVGAPVAVHHYGWTEFDVDPATKRLTVTTYGVDWYTPQDVVLNTSAVLARPVTIRQKLVVNPVPPAARCDADIVGMGDVVDGEDLSAVLAEWGQIGGVADINADGVVNGYDLSAVLGAWGPCPK